MYFKPTSSTIRQRFCSLHWQLLDSQQLGGPIIEILIQIVTLRRLFDVICSGQVLVQLIWKIFFLGPNLTLDCSIEVLSLAERLMGSELLRNIHILDAWLPALDLNAVNDIHFDNGKHLAILQDLALILRSISQLIGLSDSLTHFLFL